MTTTLRAMTHDEVAAYLAKGQEAYVSELMGTGLTREAAEANAAKTIEASFPGGDPADGNEIYDVVDGDETVGILWIAKRGESTWWVYDIEIGDTHRGKGFGRRAMLLAEERVRELGGTELGLNVFGNNRTARNLYESLGFEPTAINMSKKL